MVSRSINVWKRIHLSEWTAPLALLLAALLSYGLRLRGMGFYWDDWPYLYLFQRGGTELLRNSLGADRPTLSWLYTLMMSLLGTSPLAWQMFALLARLLTGWAFYFLLRQVWPGERMGALTAALLFTVYPGFGQQWITVVWGNGLLLLAFCLASLGLSLVGAREGSPMTRWAARSAGLIAAGMVLFSTDYFFGLELLRPALLWLVIRGNGNRQRLRLTILNWLPYALLVTAYTLWRVFFQSFSHGGFSLLGASREDFAAALLWLLERIIADAGIAGAAAWAGALTWPGALQNAWKEAAAALAALAVFLPLLAWSDDGRTGNPWPAQAMRLGLAAFLLAGVPVWVAKLPLGLSFPWDRYTLSLSAGVTLFLTGLFFWAVRNPVPRAALAAVLIAGAVGAHNVRALTYVESWSQTRDLLWQIAWRAPALPAGTLILGGGDLPAYMEDDSLTGAINWIYSPRGEGQNLDLAWLDAHERFRKLLFLQEDVEVVKGYPGAKFEGTTNQALVLRTSNSECLSLLSGPQDALRGDLDEYALRALPLARVDLAGNGKLSPNFPGFLQPEPERLWCYHYLKAQMAAQEMDWEAVKEHYDLASAQGGKPTSAAEYLPFVQAAVRTYRWGDAGELSRRALDASERVRPALCRVWREAGNWAGDSDNYQLELAELRCLP